MASPYSVMASPNLACLAGRDSHGAANFGISSALAADDHIDVIWSYLKDWYRPPGTGLQRGVGLVGRVAYCKLTVD